LQERTEYRTSLSFVQHHDRSYIHNPLARSVT